MTKLTWQMAHCRSQVLTQGRGWAGHSHGNVNAVTFPLSASTIFKVLIKTGTLAQPWCMPTPETLQGLHWKLLSWWRMGFYSLQNSASDSTFKIRSYLNTDYRNTTCPSSCHWLLLSGNLCSPQSVPPVLILRPLVSFVFTSPCS